MGKKKKEAPLHIVYVLDGSGSMADMYDAAINGFNDYVKAAQKDDPETEFVLTIFDSEHVSVSPALPVKDVKPLSKDTYIPGAATPLYDAIGKTILDTDERVTDGDRIAFVILTDGLENASTQYTRDDIFRMIRDRIARGWGFIYLGANQDSYAASGSLGIPQSNTANFSARTAQHATGAAAYASTVMYARTGAAAGLVSDTVRNELEDDTSNKKNFDSWMKGSGGL